MEDLSWRHQRKTKWLIQAVCIFVSVFVFLLHSYTNVSRMLRNPTALAYNLLQESPSLPAITICPPGGFEPPYLSNIGLNLTCDLQWECTKNYMQLKDVDFNRLSLDDIWQQGIVPLEKLVSHVKLSAVQITRDSSLWNEMWSISHTIFGPCWTLKPPLHDRIELSSTLDVSLIPQSPCSLTEKRNMPAGHDSVYTNCDEVADFCNTSCIEEKYSYTRAKLYKVNNFVYILHNRDEPPSIGNKKAVVVVDDTSPFLRKSIQFNLKQRNEYLFNTSKQCTTVNNYSLVVCESICLERAISRSMNCTPYSHYVRVPYSNEEFCMRNIFELRNEYIKSQSNIDEIELTNCTVNCLPRCSQVKYDIESKVTVRQGHHKISVQFTVPYVEAIVEETLYTTSSITSSIGGSLGLNVGAGIITIWLGILLFIQKTCNFVSTENHLKPIEQQRLKFHVSPNAVVTIWRLSGYLFCAMLFCVHTLQLLVNYSKYTVVSTIEMDATTPQFPLITICPDMPFDLPHPSFNKSIAVQELVQNNVCNKDKHCHRQDVLKYIVTNLPGFWNQTASLQEFWETSKRPIESIIHSFVFGSQLANNTWKHTLTSTGYCINLDGKNSPESNELTILFSNDDPLTAIGLNLVRTYLEASVFLLATPHSAPPFLIGSTKSENKYRYSNREILQLTRTRISRISTPTRACTHPPYNSQRCKHQCILQVAPALLNCTLPSYRPDPQVELCQTQDQYRKFPKGGALDVIPEIMNNNMQIFDKCLLKCPSECETETVHVIPIRASNSYSSDLKISYIPAGERHIKESLLIPLNKLLLEVCGILGLYFEWSVVDIITFSVVAIAEVAKRLAAVHKKCHHTMARLGRVGLVILRLSAAVIFCVTFVKEFHQHMNYPATHAQYAKARTVTGNVPAATFCSFPPFNYTRLVNIGITFDPEWFCSHNLLFLYCSENALKKYLLNFGDGLGNLSVEDVWKQSSWELADIVHSYELDNRTIRIGNNSVDDIYWRPRMTAMGQCFTFQLPSEVLETSVKFFLQMKTFRYVHDLYYPYPLDEVVEMIRGTETDMFVQLHSKNEQPLFPYGEKNVEVHNRERQLLTFEYSLTRYRSLPLKGRCLDNPNYSQRRCIEECTLKQASFDYGCRMPFLSDFHLPLNLCNESQYLKFPKYRVNIFELDLFQQFKPSCIKRCKPGCYLDLPTYKLTDERGLDASPYLAIVELKPAEEFHDLFEEVQLTTWGMLFSDMGGLASALLGVSLLSLLTSFMSAVDALWQDNRNRVAVDQ